MCRITAEVGNGAMHSCLTDPPFNTPVLWPPQPAAEAVVIGSFGIACLELESLFSLTKYLDTPVCIFGLFGLSSWPFFI